MVNLHLSTWYLITYQDSLQMMTTVTSIPRWVGQFFEKKG